MFVVIMELKLVDYISSYDSSSTCNASQYVEDSEFKQVLNVNIVAIYDLAQALPDDTPRTRECSLGFLGLMTEKLKCSSKES